MAFEQNIPFYKHDFLKHSWKVYESEHYVFHVEENSLADKEMQNIIARQEKAYIKIIESLQLPISSQKIKYYFYPSQELKEKLMGDGWFGQTIYNEATIHAVYNENDRVIGEHEDTHVISLALGLPISLFQEGLAEYMVGHSMFGNSHNEIIKNGLLRGLEFDMRDLMSQDGWLNTPDEEAEFYYSIAGSYIKYLFEFLGLEVFKNLYSSINRKNTSIQNIEIFESITHKSFNKVQDDWLKTISK